MKSLFAVCLLLVSVLSGCIGTKTDTWHGESFTELQPGWRYYRWASAPLEAGARQDNMLLVDSLVRQQIDNSLTALGYKYDEELAQFEVDYRVGDESVLGGVGPLSPTDEADRIMAGPNAEYQVSSNFYTHRTLDFHQISHLKLSFYDIGSKRIEWQTSASKLVDNPNASAADVSAAVTKTARKMMRSFPRAAL